MKKIKLLYFLSKLGFPIMPFVKYMKPGLPRRIKIIKHHGINTIFDIGANSGQYATIMRALKYKGRIISFEPLKTAFDNLQANASNDKNWDVNNFALGEKEQCTTINIARNSFSSSILSIKKAHVQSAPDSRYIGQQEIEVKKLDAVFNLFGDLDGGIMMKIDTQGFEKNVLDGAEKSIDKIKIIQVEMSITELYEKEMLYQDLIAFLEKKGFRLISLEVGFCDPNTGEVLQVDGIFLNEALTCS